MGFGSTQARTISRDLQGSWGPRQSYSFLLAAPSARPPATPNTPCSASEGSEARAGSAAGRAAAVQDTQAPAGPHPAAPHPAAPPQRGSGHWRVRDGQRKLNPDAQPHKARSQPSEQKCVSMPRARLFSSLFPTRSPELTGSAFIPPRRAAHGNGGGEREAQMKSRPREQFLFSPAPPRFLLEPPSV